MGVRITLFAIDLPRFTQFIQQSQTQDLCSVQAYLAQMSTWEFYKLLTELSQRPGQELVRLVTKGYQRWWIGSFLDYAEKTLSSKGPDYKYLVPRFQRILRGYDCGKILPKVHDTANESPFPPNLHDDPDLRMAVWTDDETNSILAIIRSIAAESAKFTRPPHKLHFAWETDEGWQNWVQQMIAQLLAIETYPPMLRTVVSFIDS
jgi:hypothetical protein